MTKTTTPMIYVADLAAYNAGNLRGIWIDARLEPHEIATEVQVMLAGSSELLAEEHAIHDTDGFEGAFISEWASFEEVHAIANLISEHGALGAELLSHWNNDVDAVKQLFDEGGYLGIWDRVADYAQEIIEASIEIPDLLEGYVDYEAIGRDMELNGEIFTIMLQGQIHIFANH